MNSFKNREFVTYKAQLVNARKVVLNEKGLRDNGYGGHSGAKKGLL